MKEIAPYDPQPVAHYPMTALEADPSLRDLQPRLASELEDAKDSLYEAHEMAEVRAEKVRELEEERRQVIIEFQVRAQVVEAELRDEQRRLASLRADISDRDRRLEQHTARVQGIRDELHALEAQLMGERGAISNTKDSYEARIVSLAELTGEFQARIKDLSGSVAKKRDQAAHLKRQILETKRMIHAALNAPKAVVGGEGNERVVTVLPPLPEDKFTLSMELVDVVAGLEEVDRRVQLRELHEYLDQKLPDLL